MLSVRVMAAGAVFLASLVIFTAPARACDDRFIKKCEKASAAAAAAAAAAEEGAPAVRTRSGKRVRVVTSRRAKHMRLAAQKRSPRLVVREESDAPRPSVTRTVALPGESILARRFRGYINPKPIAQNHFENWRKPHAAAHDFEAAAILPPAEADAAPASVQPAPAATASVVTPPKQDRLVTQPAKVAPPATMELASAESRPVKLPELAAAAPAVAAVAAPVVAPAPAVAPPTAAEASLTEAPPPAPQQPNPFSIHGLVLALCGALGAASALRFIVGA